MMIETVAGTPISQDLLHNYFRNLVNQFFKILPIRESGESSLITYMQSLQAELLGCKELVTELKNDASYLTLLSILQYLIDNPDCSVPIVKREVFKAISICNRLKAQQYGKEVSV
jgi:hypothetical protein